jgi:phage shock protein C
MRLLRSSQDYRIAGVCGGLAEAFGWNPGRLRVVWVLATVFTAFAGVVIYLGLWYLMLQAAKPAPSFDPPPMQPWKKDH